MSQLNFHIELVVTLAQDVAIQGDANGGIVLVVDLLEDVTRYFLHVDRRLQVARVHHRTHGEMDHVGVV